MKKFFVGDAVFSGFLYLYIVNRIDNRKILIDNRSLLEECRRGDREALSLLYTRFAPKMLGVIRRFVPDGEDAEDILHDGFIVAMTRLDQLRDPDYIERWLATIMRNLALRFLHEQDISTMLDEMPEMMDSPELDGFIDLDTLESLIKKLPDGYQKVFRLAVLENKSHKEIGKILGIAPNSSSSQLFHARKMMQKLITEYRLQTGIFVITGMIATGVLLLWRGADGGSVSVNEALLSEIPVVMPVDSMLIPVDSVNVNNVAVKNNAVGLQTKVLQNKKHGFDKEQIAVVPDISEEVNDSLPPVMQERVAENTDSAVIELPRVDEYVPTYAYNAESFMESPTANGWSFGASVDAGITNFKKGIGDDYYMSDIPAPPLVDPGADKDDKEKGEMRNKARRVGMKDYKDAAHHNYMPISVSLKIRKQFIGNFGVETGLNYTYLHTKFEGDGSESHCHWHYLGIPLKMTFSTFSLGKMRQYVSAGGEFSLPIYSNAVVTTTTGTPEFVKGGFKSNPVWSVSVGYGISFRVSDKVDVFVEPTLQYRFPHNYSVPNSWTDNEFGFSLPIGFRFNM